MNFNNQLKNSKKHLYQGAFSILKTKNQIIVDCPK